MLGLYELILITNNLLATTGLTAIERRIISALKPESLSGYRHFSIKDISKRQHPSRQKATTTYLLCTLNEMVNAGMPLRDAYKSRCRNNWKRNI
jgi:hypothetical protein